jgi:hypothetical protein
VIFIEEVRLMVVDLSDSFKTHSAASGVARAP